MASIRETPTEDGDNALSTQMSRQSPSSLPTLAPRQDENSSPPESRSQENGDDNANATEGYAPSTSPARSFQQHPLASLRGKGRGGRRNGSRNYSTEDIGILLNTVEEVLPQSANDWDLVASKYNEEAKERDRDQRDVKNLRVKFEKLVGLRKQTGELHPPNVRRAKKLARKLLAQANGGNEGSSNLEDESFEQARSTGGKTVGGNEFRTAVLIAPAPRLDSDGDDNEGGNSAGGPPICGRSDPQATSQEDGNTSGEQQFSRGHVEGSASIRSPSGANIRRQEHRDGGSAKRLRVGDQHAKLADAVVTIAESFHSAVHRASVRKGSDEIANIRRELEESKVSMEARLKATQESIEELKQIVLQALKK